MSDSARPRRDLVKVRGVIEGKLPNPLPGGDKFGPAYRVRIGHQLGEGAEPGQIIEVQARTVTCVTSKKVAQAVDGRPLEVGTAVAVLLDLRDSRWVSKIVFTHRAREQRRAS